jgi:hypothetical protein
MKWITELESESESESRMTFAISVKGAKELNTYIKETTHIIQAIRADLEDDLTQDAVTVRFNPICRRNHDLRAETRRLAHLEFVQNMIHDKQSPFAIAEDNVNDCLAQLDQLCQQIVNNNQQRKTETKRIQAIICEICDLLPAATFEEFGGGFVELNPRDDNVCLNQLNQLIETTKQHHKSISRKLLEEVNVILLAMRTRHIIAYNDAAQNAVGAAIHNAEQCRAYIRDCRECALIEFCASAWWMTTQKDAMDHEEYEVSVEPASTIERRPCCCDSDAMTTTMSYKSHWSDLEILVKTKDTVVWCDSVDVDIVELIITDDAVKSFEWEEAQLWYDAQQQEPDQESADE